MKARYILLTAIAAVASCTKPEALDFTPAAPERSAEYVENLLAFKARKSHKVSLAIIRTTSVAPTLQNQHLTAYPDSLDYIALTGTTSLYEGIAAEMASVRALGTKVLHVVDYSMAYDSWFEDHLDLEEGFLDHLKACTEAQISALDAFAYDGIVVSYLGKTTSDLESRAQTYFMGAVGDWIKAHSDAEVLFRGYTRNLTDPSFLNQCRWIVFVPGDNASIGQLNLAVYAQLTDGVPTDRALLEVAVPDAVDGDKSGPTATQAAAWIAEFSDRVTKKGIAFSNAQDDYFHPERIFSEIRDGINLINQ